MRCGGDRGGGWRCVYMVAVVVVVVVLESEGGSLERVMC